MQVQAKEENFIILSETSVTLFSGCSTFQMALLSKAICGYFINLFLSRYLRKISIPLMVTMYH